MNPLIKSLLALLVFFSLKGQLLAQISFSGAPIQSECKRSVEFEKDKKSGIIKVYKAGGRSMSKTFERLLLRKYNIKLVETDLFVIHDSMLCYNKFSLPYLKAKYGELLFSKTRAEAGKLDRAGKGDAWAKFKPNQKDSIRNFIYERLNPSFYKSYLQTEQKELGLYCYLQIDRTGKIYKSYGSGTKQMPIDSAINIVLQELPDKIIPALSDGKPIKGRIALRLNFTADTKRQFEESTIRK